VDPTPDEIVHIINFMPPQAGHWPGLCCHCRPEEIEAEGPCGHLVVVIAHGRVSDDVREGIKDDVRRNFRHGV
jgi:hypothetical protein